MKKYIFNFVGISIIFISIIIFNFIIGYFIIKNIPLNIPKSKNILILGDSRTRYSINDQIFDLSCNLSSSANAYIFSYIILKKVIKTNSHIDTVVLSLNQSRLNKSTDSLWLQNEYLRTKIKKFIYYMPIEEVKLFINNFDFYIGAAISPLHKAPIYLKKITNKNLDISQLEIGGYDKLNKNIVLQNIVEKNDNFFTINQIDTASMQYKYLHKIKNFCIDNKIKLILINTPVYKSIKFYDDKNSETSINKIFSDIEYLDFSDFTLNDSCYADRTHLNNKGAKIFSEYLRNNGLAK